MQGVARRRIRGSGDTVLSRLLTRKEQAVLVAFAASVCIGAAALYVHGLRAAAAPEPQAVSVPPPATVALLETPPQPARSELAPASAAEAQTLPTPIVVAVEGAVHVPGVYRLLPEARVQDLLDMANGPTDAADLSDLNRAALLVDGTTLNVPYQPVARMDGGAMVLRRSPAAAELNIPAYTISGSHLAAAAPQGAPPPAQTVSGGAAAVSGGPVDLNHAAIESLQALPGIGPALAARIAAHRARSPFRSVDDLLQVPGIGEKRLEAVRPLVTVQP